MKLRFDEIAVVSRNQQANYRPALERLRLVLMFFMCIDLFGFPTAMGGVVQTFCGFAPLAFYILSGYLVLRPDEDRPARIVRTIKRTAKVFGVLAAAYFVMNIVYYLILGVNIFYAFIDLGTWFNFLVLNIWPFDIGTAIWYVQALLYAYIIIYLLDKWKLLRFDWLISLLLIIFTVITGELCGLLPWNIAGYTYIPGNFLTRALPYILLGGFIHRKIANFRNIRSVWYWGGMVLGFALAIMEIFLLGAMGVGGYYGHLIGMTVTAVSMCMLAFKDPYVPGFERVLKMSRWHVNGIYYFCQPVAMLMMLLMLRSGDSLSQAAEFIGIATFLMCFVGAWLTAFIPRMIKIAKQSCKDDLS